MSNKKPRKETIEVEQVELIPEEFPEGPFGSAIQKEAMPVGKSSSWKKGQKRASAFVYPDKERHEDLPRQFPGAHPLEDE